jgi:hypothetical protein
MQIKGLIAPRNIFFLFFNSSIIVVFYAPLRDLITMSLQYNELYSHIILIPLISGYFVYKRRKTSLSGTNYSYISGISLIVIGAILFLVGKNQEIKLNQKDYLSLMTFSAVITFYQRRA